MYASLEDWKELDRYQKFGISYYCSTLSSIIRRHSANGNKIVDIGCGTGQVMSKVFSDFSNELSLKYHGIDLDAGALLIASDHWSATNAKYNLENTRVDQDNLPAADIYICLANTLLSLGSRLDIEGILKKASSKTNRTLAIWSVIPWDHIRKQYYAPLSNWDEIVTNESILEFRGKIDETEDHIKYTFELKCSNRANLQITHSSLKLDSTGIENLLSTSGWNIISWVDPVTGTEVDPNQTNTPEFYVICVNGN